LSKEQKGKVIEKIIRTNSICDACKDDATCKVDYPVMRELARKHGSCTWFSELLIKGKTERAEMDIDENEDDYDNKMS